MNYLAQRRADLNKLVKADEVDAFYLGDPTNVGYMTGLGNVAGVLVLSSRRTVFIGDEPDVRRLTESYDGADFVVRRPDQSMAQAAGEAIGKLGVKSVGFDADTTTVGEVERVTTAAGKVALRPVKGRLADIRAIKDPGEVEHIREAVRIADRAFSMFRALLHEGDTEKEMADALDAFVRRAVRRRAAFPAVVAVGEHGAASYDRPTERAVSEGSKVVVEWGADVGYKCAMARSMKSPFAVTPTRKTKTERIGQNFDKVAAAVLHAQRSALGAIMPEVPCKDVYAAARKSVTDAGFGDFFPPSVGHGIGLEVVEGPTLSPASPEMLRAGMILVVTSAISIPEWGAVRVGDTVLVTRDGVTVFGVTPTDPAAFE